MRADIFCRVVDNYGDIGVCWRLARRLAHGRGWQVCLWVDALAAFATIEPEVDAGAARQTVQGIALRHWVEDDPASDCEPADVAIEAFACTPPAAYVARMAPGRTVWVNLEYLSAEDWVESCHGLPSLQPGGQSKFFFFPGFTPATGGLLREPALIAERDAWQADPAHAGSLLADTLGLDATTLQAWRDGARLMTLFCYPHAPAGALVAALAADPRPTVLLVPRGVAPQLEQLLAPAAGLAGVGTAGALRVARIPFVSQPDFDRLLWSADLNLMRGEDSIVRALWAGRPLLWQIYPQDEDTHLVKLRAWMQRYAPPDFVRELLEAWNLSAPGDDAARGRLADQAFVSALQQALVPARWRDWRQAARARCDEAARQTDLADKLADFCEVRFQTG